MQEHIDDNSIPNDVPAFAKSFFAGATGGGFTPAPPAAKAAKPVANQPAEANGGGKRKGNGEAEQQAATGQKKAEEHLRQESEDGSIPYEERHPRFESLAREEHPQGRGLPRFLLPREKV